MLIFLDLSTTSVIADRTHSQSPILRTKGVLSNLVILTNLQTKLHPPYANCLLVLNLDQKVSSMLEECGPVDFLGCLKVQFLTKLTDMSK